LYIHPGTVDKFGFADTLWILYFQNLFQKHCGSPKGKPLVPQLEYAHSALDAKQDQDAEAAETLQIFQVQGLRTDSARAQGTRQN